ncbi:helix-turn-helix domain-containing protein [Dokdonella fugitiva]|jgi:DNA-binding transcriptional regulator YiaG|uniref:Helix-turn-helix protein n=1 Tax=Dokdonella fugitiva TaxID=328517 RepID=A0A4R2I8H7_9GAMM|nr:helix-turn-helix transcriptional regulator [Dokdonella fugitiva]MBA8883115.1 DNA-binding transcriptional regulator YiaG [Dokdonella fugitiva]TCO40427.1 helix-turn-helix protein [Dokdonella fugitiva]
MPNIATFLKAEITRLARKEIRGEIGTLRKTSAAHRRDIAALKREIANLQRQNKQLSKRAAGASQAATAESGEGEVRNRFSAKGFKSMRARLGLSADQLATLLGASMQSVYNWEHGKTVPRANQVAAIAALRTIGKKEAMRRLEEAQAAEKPSRKR